MLSNVGEFGFVILGKAAGIGLLGRKVRSKRLVESYVSGLSSPIGNYGF